MGTMIKKWILEHKCRERNLPLGTCAQMQEAIRKHDEEQMSRDWNIIANAPPRKEPSI